MWLTSSSIGRKFVMAITGAFLILFVTFHAAMNGVAIFWPSAYNEICEFLGANWYALVGSAVLALGFIAHIIYAVWLTVQNRKARGHERYAVESRPKQVEWSSKNMLVLGIVILAFLVVHLIQFWCKMQYAEIFHVDVVAPDGQSVPPAAGTWFLELAFSNGLTLAVYLVGFVALWFHMTHGFWSMFHSSGWDGAKWINRLKCIGYWYTTIVVGLFVAEAIVFTVQAHRHVYTTCPALQEQYQEMREGSDDCQSACVYEEEIVVACEAEDACEHACGQADGACEHACDQADGQPCPNACQEPCGQVCDRHCDGTPCASCEHECEQQVTNK